MMAISEIEERTKRSSNVMLFNLKESGESSEEIVRIMDAQFEVLKAIRIGKRLWSLEFCVV